MAEDNNNEENVQVDPNTTTATPAKTPPADHGPVGCYLVYEPSSGGRLMLQYSKGPIPPNSVGFWTSPHKLPEFKFKQAAGRSELIKGIAGGDANRRKYFKRLVPVHQIGQTKTSPRHSIHTTRWTIRAGRRLRHGCE